MYYYLDGDDLQELISKQGLSHYFVFVHICIWVIFEGKILNVQNNMGKGKYFAGATDKVMIILTFTT